MLQQCPVNFGIRGDKTQHGRHIGLYHARAFGYAVNGDGLPGNGDGFRNAFGECVRSHDCAGGFIPVIRRQIFYGQRQRCCQLSNGQQLSDHASGKGQYLIGSAACDLCQSGARQQCILHALFTGSGVGIARINQ